MKEKMTKQPKNQKTIGPSILTTPYHAIKLLELVSSRSSWCEKRPESRVRPRATQQGCAKCGGTSPSQRSGHRKKFRGKADNQNKMKTLKSNTIVFSIQDVF